MESEKEGKRMASKLEINEDEGLTPKKKKLLLEWIGSCKAPVNWTQIIFEEKYGKQEEPKTESKTE